MNTKQSKHPPHKHHHHNTRHLLIDADVLVYKAASSVEKIIKWEDDLIFPVASLVEASCIFDNHIANLCDTLETDSYILCFSDSIHNNFRKTIYPEYKANRATKARPVALSFLREEIFKKRKAQCAIYHSLEADDVIGLLATNPAYVPHAQKIVVSVDKDMKTLPCTFFDIGKPYDASTGYLNLQQINPAQADYYFMLQTLTGDTTDNYPGCPRYGKVKATQLLNSVKTPDEYWEVVCSAFNKAGCSFDYAVTMARLARILRSEDYDYKQQRVKLWTPPLHSTLTTTTDTQYNP